MISRLKNCLRLCGLLMSALSVGSRAGSASTAIGIITRMAGRPATKANGVTATGMSATIRGRQSDTGLALPPAGPEPGVGEALMRRGRLSSLPTGPAAKQEAAMHNRIVRGDCPVCNEPGIGCRRAIPSEVDDMVLRMGCANVDLPERFRYRLWSHGSNIVLGIECEGSGGVPMGVTFPRSAEMDWDRAVCTLRRQRPRPSPR